MSIFHSDAFCKLNGLQAYRIADTCFLAGPSRGTYGGFHGCKTMDQMASLMCLVNGEAFVKLAPQGHDPVLFAKSFYVLMHHGFRVHYADLNYERRCLNIDFSEGLSSGARKKLSKCERAGLQCSELARNSWKRAHAMIAANRERSGHSLSMSLQSILETDKAIPGAYRFFGVFDDADMVAAAITVRLSDDLLYVWAWGDAKKNELSPTTMLAKHIYEQCAFMGSKLMDIGIATEKGIPNYGLMRFKESLGFTPSLKLTMYRPGA